MLTEKFTSAFASVLSIELLERGTVTDNRSKTKAFSLSAIIWFEELRHKVGYEALS